MDLALNLKKLREARGISQTDLADRMDVSLAYYNKMERYVMKPSVETLIVLSKIYGITLDEMVYLNRAVLEKVAGKKATAKKSAKRK